MAILKVAEWETPSGWAVADTSAILKGSSNWWHIPHALQMSYKDYFNMLHDEYHVISMKFIPTSSGKRIFIFRFPTKEDAHACVLRINAAARRNKYVAY